MTCERIRKIVFLDRPCRYDEEDALFIAMTPSIYSYLKQRGARVHSTSQYFTRTSHEELLLRSESIVKWIENNAPFFDYGIGTKTAFKNTLIFYTRFAVHYCLWTAEVVMNAVESHRPEIISAPKSGRIPANDLYIHPEEEYLGTLVERIAQLRRLRYEGLPVLNRIGENGLLAKAGSIFRFILKIADFNIWEMGLLKERRSSRKGPVIFTTRRYQMHKLAKDLEAALPDTRPRILKGPIAPNFDMPNFIIKIFWKMNGEAMARQKTALTKYTRLIELNVGVFKYREINFPDIIAQKIRDGIGNYIMGAIVWGVRLNDFLERVRPSLIVSGSNRPDDMILAELCREKHIRTILVSHGSLVPPKNRYEQIEWFEHERNFSRMPFTAYTLQTPVAEDYFKVNTSESMLIRTGPLIWGRPVKRMDDKDVLYKRICGNRCTETKIVVHAGTPKPTVSLRPYIYETPDEYIDALCDLAEAIKGMQKVLLVIKFRPTRDIAKDDLISRIAFSDNVILSVDEPFDKVLALSNLLVSFSSTSIEEALQNGIPVLQYGGGGRYQHLAAQEILSGSPITKSAIYHVSGKGDLRYAIQGIVSLDIGRPRDEELFARYIYPVKERVIFEALVEEYIGRTLLKKRAA